MANPESSPNGSATTGDTTLQLLRDITVLANTADDVNGALQFALERLCQHTGWQLGHALTVSAEGALSSGNVWHSTAAQDGRFDQFRFAATAVEPADDSDLAGRAWASGQVVWIPVLDANEDSPRVRAALSAGLHGGCALPVLSGQRVLAVLEFYTTEAPTPSPQLTELLTQIGIQLGRVFERAHSRDALCSSEAHTQRILDSANEAFVAMNSSGRITDWNAAAQATFGWSRAEVLDRTVSEMIVPPAYREAHNRGFKRFVATGQGHVIGQRIEITGLHRDGHEFPIELTHWALAEDEGWSFYAFIRDISERKVAEAKLTHRALHDSLTGLPNRTHLLEWLRAALSRHERSHGELALLFLDLDRFKRINDSLGHRAGDEVLVAVSARLRTAVRPTDMVARLASDEFVIACADLPGEQDARRTAERLLDALREPIQLNDDSVFVSASIGVALAGDACDGNSVHDADGLLAAADNAMYRAKLSGRGHFEVFDNVVSRNEAVKRHTETELRRALEGDQFRLYYQPQFSITTGDVVGVEALIRWEHPERGLLGPGAFVDLAEESGLIVPIGQWVISEACRQARAWQDERPGGGALEVSVNLSGRQLAQSDLIPFIAATVARAGFDPDRIRFGCEVTESVLMSDPEAAAERLRELRELGVTLSIDDFGTGYSSLAYLKRFPASTLKIDRSFVMGVDSDPTDHAIIRSVIELAHGLGLSVVAEGIETPEQLRVLGDLRADTAQGFLFERPQPPEALHGLLTGNGPTTHSGTPPLRMPPPPLSHL